MVSIVARIASKTNPDCGGFYDLKSRNWPKGWRRYELAEDVFDFVEDGGAPVRGLVVDFQSGV